MYLVIKKRNNTVPRTWITNSYLLTEGISHLLS